MAQVEVDKVLGLVRDVGAWLGCVRGVWKEREKVRSRFFCLVSPRTGEREERPFLFLSLPRLLLFLLLTKVPPDDAVPQRRVPPVKLLLDVRGDVLLDRVLVDGLEERKGWRSGGGG